MRKLFLTFLMLGVFGLAYALQPDPKPEKFTVTGFSNGVLTVNYDKKGDGPADAAKVKQVLNKWVEDTYDLRGPENEEARAAKLKEVVTTLKLTGDWDNYQMVIGEPLAVIVDMCASSDGVGLDLSECTGLKCIYEGVEETYDADRDDGTVTFTYSPVVLGNTVSNPVDIVQKSVLAEERPIYHEATYIKNEVTPNIVGNEIQVVKDELTPHTTYWIWGGYTQLTGLEDLDPSASPISNYQFNGKNNTLVYKKTNDEDEGCWYIYWNGDENASEGSEPVTAKSTYTNNRTGETVTDLSYVQKIGDKYYYIDYIYALNQGETPSSNATPPEGAMQFGDKWIIPEKNSSSFTFVDEKGIEQTKSYAQVIELLTQDEDGNWWYEGYKYNDALNDVQFSKTTDIFVLDDNGKYQFVAGSYYVYEDEDGIEHKVYDTNDLTQNTEGEWVYSYTAYEYDDKYGNRVSTPNRHDPYNLSEGENGTLWYVYQNTSGNFTFEGYQDKISSIVFPDHDEFTFIPGNLFQGKPTLQTAVLSNKIRAIGNHAFASVTSLTSINFPSSLEEIGGGAFENTRLTDIDLSNTQITRIRWCTFMKNPALLSCTYPTTLEWIEYHAFLEDRNLQSVDLSECHNLTLIGHKAYMENDNLQSVKVCAHPKVIQGKHGHGAFYNCKVIKTVEIVMNGCEITDITQCWCEYGAFDADVTYDQTVADLEQIDKTTARLIFPENAPVGNSTYNSSWDFFVGDYKAGKAIKQESLQNYYKDVPWNVGGGYLDELEPGHAVDYKTGEEFGDVRYAGNGWLEFINTGYGVVITPDPDPSGDKMEFLRTYSRSKGDGPVVLPKEIIAYRAIDYASTAWDMIEVKDGRYYKAIDEITSQEYYEEITEETDLSQVGTRYDKLTVGGQMLLRPLWAKVPAAGKTARDYNVKTDYVAANALNVYTETESIDGASINYQISYVPENTGVVLYSTNISEKVFLLLKKYEGDDLVLMEYPNTEQEYEAHVGSQVVAEDRVNMLEGSYDVETPVAPVFPWDFKKHTYNPTDRQYRNFGFNKAKRHWIRLMEGNLRLNRAFAQVPSFRFDNFNETEDQQPDFTFEDHLTGTESNIIAIGFKFEDGETTNGIKTVNNVKVDDDAWYTIEGIKVSKPTRGIYIHNNRKVVIK